MPWVRIDENAMDHPKIGALPDGAFRLWVQGLAYCQKHLTDGFVSDVAVRSLLSFSPKRRAILEAAGLWDKAEAGVYVHDYLDWNDSREKVTEKREAAKERMRQARDRRSRELRENKSQRSPERAREVLRGVVCSEEKQASTDREGGAGETKPDAARVSRFVDRYRDLHEQYIGVAYLGNVQKDYWAACELVSAFDDDMLEKIAVYGLNDTDPFMTNGTRTLTKLKSRASEYAATLKARKFA